MTDLVHHQPPSTGLAPASVLIRQTAQDLSDAHRIATALVSTAFAPQHFRGKPEEGAAAILYGATIDMDPLTALQNLYVISGKPALYARAMVAVVMSKGHRIWTEHEDDGTVTVAGQRKGSEAVERVTWTSEMAKRAGYSSNKKYQTDPRSMLYARASGDVARRIAPDALLGMAHNVEELTIDPTAGGTDSVPAQRRVSAADFTPQQEPTPATAPAPVAASDWEEVPDAPAPDIEAIDEGKKVRGRMFALLSERGIDDADEQRRGMSNILGRTIASRTELTVDDMRAIIRSLEETTEPVQDELDADEATS